MKKLVAIFAIGTMVALSACAKKEAASEGTADSAATMEQTAPAVDSAAAAPADSAAAPAADSAAHAAPAEHAPAAH